MKFGWISSLYYYIKIYLYLFIKNEKRENLQYLDGRVYTLKNIPSYALNCYESILETKPNFKKNNTPTFFFSSTESIKTIHQSNQATKKP